MKALALARCCSTHRIEAIELISSLIANDAAGSVHSLIDAGWEPVEAVATARIGYSGWLLAHIADAVETGVQIAAVQLGLDPDPAAHPPAPCPLCETVR